MVYFPHKWQSVLRAYCVEYDFTEFYHSYLCYSAHIKLFGNNSFNEIKFRCAVNVNRVDMLKLLYWYDNDKDVTHYHRGIQAKNRCTTLDRHEQKHFIITNNIKSYK